MDDDKCYTYTVMRYNLLSDYIIIYILLQMAVASYHANCSKNLCAPFLPNNKKENVILLETPSCLQFFPVVSTQYNKYMQSALIKVLPIRINALSKIKPTYHAKSCNHTMRDMKYKERSKSIIKNEELENISSFCYKNYLSKAEILPLMSMYHPHTSQAKKNYKTHTNIFRKPPHKECHRIATASDKKMLSTKYVRDTTILKDTNRSCNRTPIEVEAMFEAKKVIIQKHSVINRYKRECETRKTAFRLNNPVVRLNNDNLIKPIIATIFLEDRQILKKLDPTNIKQAFQDEALKCQLFSNRHCRKKCNYSYESG